MATEVRFHFSFSVVFLCLANTPPREGPSTWSQERRPGWSHPTLDRVRSREARLRAGLRPLLFGQISALAPAYSNNATRASHTRFVAQEIFYETFSQSPQERHPPKTAIASWNLRKFGQRFAIG